MKLVLLKSHLREALAAVERASADNANLPVLRNVLVAAGDGEVRLSATNLEIGVVASAAAKVIEKGSASVPAGLLAGIIGNLQSERLNLELHGGSLEIATDNYRATVQTLPAEEFPSMPTVASPNGILIPAQTLSDALARVIPSAQSSDIRPELGSVLFSYVRGELKLAATDSFRLAEKTIPGSQIEEEGSSEEFRMLVPLKTAQEMARIFKGDERVTIRRDEHQVFAATKNASLISRLVGGTFPDYEPRIPKEFSTEVTLETKEFLSAVRLTGVVGARSGEVMIRVGAGEKNVEVRSIDQGVGENACVVPAKVQGGANVVSFNWRYLLDGVKAVDGDELCLGLTDGSRPALMRSPRDGSFFYIVMPILKA